MNTEHQKALERAREKARGDAECMHPPGPARSEFMRWLTVKNYLEFISPITVPEIYDMLP